MKLLCPFPCPRENNLGQARVTADGFAVPHQPALAFGGVSPDGLAGGEALLDAVFWLAEENGDVLRRVQAVGNKKGNDDNVPRLGGVVAVGDEGGFFHEGGLDVGVFAACADGLHLRLDGVAGIFIFLSPMPGNEEGGFFGARRSGKWVLVDDVACAREEDLGHVQVRADGATVNELASIDLPGVRIADKSEAPPNDLLREMALTDGDGDNENAWCVDIRDVSNLGFLQVKRGAHLREEFAGGELFGELTHGLARQLVECRPVTD